MGGNSGAIIDLRPIKHICLVGNNCARVHGTHPSSPDERFALAEGGREAAVSKDGRGVGASWFETRFALLTMRV